MRVSGQIGRRQSRSLRNLLQPIRRCIKYIPQFSTLQVDSVYVNPRGSLLGLAAAIRFSVPPITLPHATQAPERDLSKAPRNSLELGRGIGGAHALSPAICSNALSAEPDATTDRPAEVVGEGPKQFLQLLGTTFAQSSNLPPSRSQVREKGKSLAQRSEGQSGLDR